MEMSAEVPDLPSSANSCQWVITVIPCTRGLLVNEIAERQRPKRALASRCASSIEAAFTWVLIWCCAWTLMCGGSASTAAIVTPGAGMKPRGGLRTSGEDSGVGVGSIRQPNMTKGVCGSRSATMSPRNRKAGTSLFSACRKAVSGEKLSPTSSGAGPQK